MKNKYFIIDFDSTLVSVETLEHLASFSLSNNLNKEEILKEIRAITIMGMEGQISFNESLNLRLSLISANKSDVEKTAQYLTKKISLSIQKNIDFFKKYKNNIYIISGSFKECAWPVIQKFEIEENHVLMNSFTYDKTGKITGADLSRPEAFKFGKAISVAGLRLTGTIYIVGDGYTDFEIKQYGVGDYFIAYTENVSRFNVVKHADCIAKSFDDVIDFINKT